MQRLLGYFLIAMAVLHGTILLLCAAAFKTVEDPSIYQPLTAYTLGAMYSDRESKDIAVVQTCCFETQEAELLEFEHDSQSSGACFASSIVPLVEQTYQIMELSTLEAYDCIDSRVPKVRFEASVCERCPLLRFRGVNKKTP